MEGNAHLSARACEDGVGLDSVCLSRRLLSMGRFGRPKDGTVSERSA